MASAELELLPLTEDTFVPERTLLLLQHACRLAGLDPTGAELLRHQTNAVYRLRHKPVVVKIARPGIRHAHEVVPLARWLAEHGVPSVRLWETEQPLSLAGCVVSFWYYLHQDHPMRAMELAKPLWLLHQLPTPPIPLPALAPLRAIRRSVTNSRMLSPAEQQLLLQRCDALAEPYTGLEYELAPHLIHGDPQHRNALWDTETGRPVLCDWDSACFGQPEWDLVTIEVHCRRFGYPPQEYEAFCERYGVDVRQWPGFPVLRDMRELRMIATNARKSVLGTPQAAEVQRRVEELSEGSSLTWRIL